MKIKKRNYRRVIRHELGHFSSAAGERLYFIMFYTHGGHYKYVLTEDEVDMFEDYYEYKDDDMYIFDHTCVFLDCFPEARYRVSKIIIRPDAIDLFAININIFDKKAKQWMHRTTYFIEIVLNLFDTGTPIFIHQTMVEKHIEAEEREDMGEREDIMNLISLRTLLEDIMSIPTKHQKEQDMIAYRLLVDRYRELEREQVRATEYDQKIYDQDTTVLLAPQRHQNFAYLQQRYVSTPSVLSKYDMQWLIALACLLEEWTFMAVLRDDGWLKHE